MKTHSDTQPWYRQFWPWFLIVLPASVVVAGIVTVVISFRHSDSVVSDNYYKEGLAINRVVAQDRRAQALGLSADLHVAGDTVELVLNGELMPPSALHLAFEHPLQAARDFSLPLSRRGDNRYEGQLPATIDGRWYLEVSDITGDWRLQGELQLSSVCPEALLPPLGEGRDGGKLLPKCATCRLSPPPGPLPEGGGTQQSPLSASINGG